MHYASDGTYWVVEDKGNKNELYQFNPEGKLRHTLRVKNTKNTDWEDLTTDDAGNIYIGDFGNNKNTRQDLRIIKIGKDSLPHQRALPSAVISFYYPEQKDFPPQKTELLYDAEAFFLWEDWFYIFTKNRSKGFDGTTLVYKVPNQEGHHPAILVGKLKTCAFYKHCALTGAAISPDKKTIALLSHSKVWLLTGFDADSLPEADMEEINLHHVSQKESVAFLDNETLLLADEVKKNTGGKVYKLHLNPSKTKP